MYKLSEKKEGRADNRKKKRERERESGRDAVSAARRGRAEQMELAGSLVGPSREIEVAFLRAY